MVNRTNLLPFALPDLGDAELREVKEVLDSGWITTGAKTHNFEAEFASYVGAKHAIAVNSCTAAMHLALEAAGVGPGDLVATTPYTFAATAEVIHYLGAVPVLVDVEPATLNMDPRCLDRTIQDLQRSDREPGTASMPAVVRALSHQRMGVHAAHPKGALKAIIPVDIAGHPCEIDAICEIAAEHGLAVVEDAAHACSAGVNGRRIGATPSSQVRSSTCFSFYATKTLATGEGGMVTTDEDDWAARIRLMSLHGISKDAWKRYTAEGSWYYEILEPGYKYNMPDIIAALGLAQLKKVDSMRQRRQEIAGCYNDAFSQYPEVQIPTERDHVSHAWHLYMLRVQDNLLTIGRDEFIQNLKARNISSSVHFIPLHVHPYYRTAYGYLPEDLPVAFREYQREISLPIYSKMSDADVQSVINAVTDVLVQFRARASHANARP